MISSTSSSSFDFIRALSVAGYGLLFLGTSQHLWFNFMSKVLPKRDVLTTFKKVFMGQECYPFFSYNAALQGEQNFYFIMISVFYGTSIFMTAFIVVSPGYLVFFSTTRLQRGSKWSILYHLSFVQVCGGNTRALLQVSMPVLGSIWPYGRAPSV